MKYVIAQYNNLNPFNNVSIPIGVVLQSEDRLFYKFDISKDRFGKIKSIAPDADPETFNSFNKAFEENFVKVPFIETSDDKGNKVKIKPTDPEFLDYLTSTYQTFYQYSNSKEIEGSDPDKYLDLLYRSFIT